MDGSMPGLPVHHQLPELTHTHVHQVGGANQTSHPLSSPSLPAFNLSQHQGKQIQNNSMILASELDWWFYCSWALRVDKGSMKMMCLHNDNFKLEAFWGNQMEKPNWHLDVQISASRLEIRNTRKEWNHSEGICEEWNSGKYQLFKTSQNRNLLRMMKEAFHAFSMPHYLQQHFGISIMNQFTDE